MVLERIESIKAGHFGESRTDRFIEEVQFPNEVFIIPNFHTKLHPKRFIQIDTIIITRSYVLVIEVKNIIGTVRFQFNPPQIIRTKNNEEETFDCPLVQLERNCDGISKIVTDLRLNIRIQEALVFSSQNLIVEKAPSNRNIYFVKQLPLLLQKLNKLPPNITIEEFHLLNKTLTNMNKNFFERPLCDRFSINPEHLKKGILCIYCGEQLTRLNKRKWNCHQCNKTVAQPVQRNIENLFLLINHRITMKDCLHYLQPDSRETMKHYLHNMKLSKIGNRRTTIYTNKKT